MTIGDWRWLAVLVLAFVPCVVSCAEGTATLSVTGAASPDFASFDELMRSFMTAHKVPGGALAVARHGRVVYARGFGYADAAKKQPVQPTSLFRIASLSKSLTGVAVMQLIEQGKLKLDDAMLPLLPPDTRPATIGDPRMERITVRQLLQHSGGWDIAKLGFDPMFHSVEIVKAEKCAPPAGPKAIIRYMLQRKLNTEPGEAYAYSNFGYCILGRIIEQASGQSYEAYVKEHVLAPLGIKEMRVGKTLLEGRAAGEVEYIDRKGREGPAVIGAEIGRKVPLPYGSFYVEAMDSHGGWIASAAELARFVAAFDDPARCTILKPESVRAMWERPAGTLGLEKNGAPKTAFYACGWMVRPAGNSGKVNAWHGGLLPGTSTLMVHRNDGLSWVVLFNTESDEKGKELAGLIDGLVHQAADAAGNDER